MLIWSTRDLDATRLSASFHSSSPQLKHCSCERLSNRDCRISVLRELEADTGGFVDVLTCQPRQLTNCAHDVQ
jgi:hypothetical protein